MNTNNMKPLAELTLLDKFLFDCAVSDPQICQLILEISLSRQLSGLKINNSEKVIDCFHDSRSVRLDLLALDTGNTYYDAEMQKKKKYNLPRRSRYYNAQIDVSLLEIGETDFNKLNDVYVIFICPYDLFGENKYRYTFRCRCDENPDLCLDDGSVRVFLNTKGSNDSEVPSELVEFLHYVDSGFLSDAENASAKVSAVDTYIRQLKSNHEIGVKYMDRWYDDLIARKEAMEEGREEGREVGRKEGREEGREEGRRSMLITIIRSMIIDGRTDEDIARLIKTDVRQVAQIHDLFNRYPDEDDIAIAKRDILLTTLTAEKP